MTADHAPTNNEFYFLIRYPSKVSLPINQTDSHSKLNPACHLHEPTAVPAKQDP